MRVFKQRPIASTVKLHKVLGISATLLLIGVGLSVIFPAYGDQILLQRSLRLDNALPGKTASYQISFTIQDPDAVGSLKLLLCGNSPLESDPCSAPAELDISSATLVQSNGFIDMSISSSTPNTMVLSRPLALPVAAPLTVIFKLTGVTNPSAAGSYYLRIATYGSTDASGARIDFGGIAYAIANPINVTAEVPPYLLFCAGVTVAGLDCNNVAGNYVNFGDINPQSSASGQSQMLVATNAANGYNVVVSGNTLTSGNNIISALPTPDVPRPGTSQFGMNLRANTDPTVGADVTGPGNGQPASNYNVPDKFMFQSGDIVALYNLPENYRKYTVSYLVNMAQSQPIGVYVSTLAYVATANF